MSILSRLQRVLGGGGRKVDVQQAQQLQQSGAVLLDVRSREEFKNGHAPRASNLPLDQLSDRGREIPTGRQVLAICQSGGRSARATAPGRAASAPALPPSTRRTSATTPSRRI